MAWSDPEEVRVFYIDEDWLPSEWIFKNSTWTHSPEGLPDRQGNAPGQPVAAASFRERSIEYFYASERTIIDLVKKPGMRWIVGGLGAFDISSPPGPPLSKSDKIALGTALGVGIPSVILALLGLLMMTYPPLWVMLCIQVAFAITTILMLWSVSIKAASLLGDHSEQGKIMGWMEGLRGVGVMSLAVFTMWVFSRFAPDDSNSLKTVILIYSVVYILLGILCWFFVSDSPQHIDSEKEEKQAFQFSDILTVLRISTTWYCSMVIFGVLPSSVIPLTI